MNQQELQLILQEGEGYRIEFKESLNNSISKELVAFANASGGKIFLGIDDNNSICGVKISNELKSNVQDYANNCDPSVNINNESTKVSDLLNDIQASIITIKRDLAKLKDAGIIEYQGSLKKGFYVLSDKYKQ